MRQPGDNFQDEVARRKKAQSKLSDCTYGDHNLDFQGLACAAVPWRRRVAALRLVPQHRIYVSALEHRYAK